MLIANEIARHSEFPPLAGNNAVGVAGNELRKEGERELGNAVMGSVFWAATVLRGKAQSKLFELEHLGSNWDSYGAPAPNNAAVQNAVRILEMMQPFDLAFTSIVPSAEGGIGFCFARGEFYADIESSNEGEILGVRYAGMEAPVLIQIDGTDNSIKAALEEVRNHIRA
jgi:hypothetical protein